MAIILKNAPKTEEGRKLNLTKSRRNNTRLFSVSMPIKRNL